MDKNYSHKTIAQKLGINSGDEITVINPPENYLKIIGLSSIKLGHILKINSKLIHYFTVSKFQLEKEFPKLKGCLAKDGVLWVSNPKDSLDLDQTDVMEIGLKNGLVDVKVASLNNDWSAMKFVYRLKDR